MPVEYSSVSSYGRKRTYTDLNEHVHCWWFGELCSEVHALARNLTRDLSSRDKCIKKKTENKFCASARTNDKVNASVEINKSSRLFDSDIKQRGTF